MRTSIYVEEKIYPTEWTTLLELIQHLTAISHKYPADAEVSLEGGLYYEYSEAYTEPFLCIGYEREETDAEYSERVERVSRNETAGWIYVALPDLFKYANHEQIMEQYTKGMYSEEISNQILQVLLKHKVVGDVT